MTFYVALQLGYQLALAALTTRALLAGSRKMKRTIITIMATFVAAWLMRGWWPSIEYAAAMIAVDSVALLVITWHPAGRWQGVVGLSFILQIGVHIGRIASGNNADMNSYWWLLSLLAIFQLLLFGGWLINDWMARYRDRRDHNPAPAKAGDAGAVR